MKKFAISLIALAAISTASVASSRSYDLRDSDTYFGKYSAQLMDKSASVNAMTVIKKTKAVTNFERLKWISEENDQGGRH
jgi:hypothetical protein